MGRKEEMFLTLSSAEITTTVTREPAPTPELGTSASLVIKTREGTVVITIMSPETIALLRGVIDQFEQECNTLLRLPLTTDTGTVSCESRTDIGHFYQFKTH